MNMRKGAVGSFDVQQAETRGCLFYALHRQTTCEHLDIKRYEKKVCV